MKTNPLRCQILRGLGAMQILAAVALCLAILHSHGAYKASIASVLPAATTSLGATAEVLSQLARDVQDNQVVLDRLTMTLGSYTDLLAQSKASVQQMTGLLPEWNKTFADVSRRSKEVGKIMKNTADTMGFHVPTGLTFEGMSPKITWSVPLRFQAQELRHLGSETDDFGKNIDNSWGVLLTNATAMSQAFVKTCDTTVRLLADTKNGVAKLRKEDLGPAITRINDAAAGLNGVAQGISQTNPFVDSLFYLGLVLSASVGLSGLSIFLVTAHPSSSGSGCHFGGT